MKPAAVTNMPNNKVPIAIPAIAPLESKLLRVVDPGGSEVLDAPIPPFEMVFDKILLLVGVASVA